MLLSLRWSSANSLQVFYEMTQNSLQVFLPLYKIKKKIQMKWKKKKIDEDNRSHVYDAWRLNTPRNTMVKTPNMVF